MFCFSLLLSLLSKSFGFYIYKYIPNINIGINNNDINNHAFGYLIVPAGRNSNSPTNKTPNVNFIIAFIINFIFPPLK